MTYPRTCPVCSTIYFSGLKTGHVSLGAEAGGTPSPWRPRDPGRLILLACQQCGATYWWDYFGSALASDRPIGRRRDNTLAEPLSREEVAIAR